MHIRFQGILFYNRYRFACSNKTVYGYKEINKERFNGWRLYTEIENYSERGRVSLKQFQNFSKPFLSALIKFVQSKPIIYENKTIWQRWYSNTLHSLSIYFLSVSLSYSFTQTHTRAILQHIRLRHNGKQEIRGCEGAKPIFSKGVRGGAKSDGKSVVFFFYTLLQKGLKIWIVLKPEPIYSPHRNGR